MYYYHSRCNLQQRIFLVERYEKKENKLKKQLKENFKLTRRLIGSGVTDSNGNVGVEYTGTGAGKFWTNYHMFGVHTVQWNRGTTTISDLKIKQI